MTAGNTDEHKERLTPRLRLHPLTNEPTESLISHPHVNGLQRHVDRKTLANHVTAPSVSST
jgi:hypothetical protein